MTKTTTTTNNDMHEYINQLSRKAAAGTLKRIVTASANPTTMKLQQSLQADFNTIDNGHFDRTISDAYDIYMTAYTYLWERIAVDEYTTEDTITVTLKNGNEKTRTVFQWACVKCRQYIYGNKALENNGKIVYIEDLVHNNDETWIEVLDREYIRMGLYNGIQTYEDYASYEEMLNKLGLSEKQEAVIKMRMRGMSVTAIAEKLGVTHPAVSKYLAKAREKAISAYPELVRYFDMSKI